MSWLYSIVIAGLLFSSNEETAVKSREVRIDETSAAVIARSDETEKFEQTYPIAANGRVGVSNVNGSIVVEAWDRNEVKLEATKIADSKESLAAVEIKVDSQADAFRVEADYSNWKHDRDKGWKNHRKIEVQFRLWVPRTAVLDEVETVNGSVTVSNFVNRTKISAVNGNVSATNLRGAANLSTVNGEVTADFDRLEMGSRISLSTVNGRVNLVIPSDANATIKADSLNGSITNDFGLTVRKGKYVGRDLFGRVGSGDVQIKLDSVNGGLSISRKNDGKTQNPATNLQQKNKDDENWDDDSNDEDAVSAAQLNREIAGAIKDSRKHTAAELREARKEIDRIRPELAKVNRESFKKAAEAISKAGAVLNSEEFRKKIEEVNRLRKEEFSGIDYANFSRGVPFIEKKSGSFQTKGTPNVVVDAKGCNVRVRGWDKPEVKYVVTSLGNRGRSPIEVEEVRTDSGVSLKVVNTNDRTRDDNPPDEDLIEFAKPEGVDSVSVTNKKAVVTMNDGTIEKYNLNRPDEKKTFERKYGRHSPPAPPKAPASSLLSPDFRWGFDMFGDRNRVRIEVFVPKKSNLKIVTDGEIRLDGVSGDIKLEGEDEAINVRDGGGNLHLSAAQAQVRVIGFRGAFDSQTECGDVYLEGDFENINADSVDGSFILTVPENQNADLQADVDAISVENLSAPKKVSKGNWRFGTGGPKYTFRVAGGRVRVRNLSTLTAN